jgi:hypothetical protein
MIQNLSPAHKGTFILSLLLAAIFTASTWAAESNNTSAASPTDSKTPSEVTIVAAVKAPAVVTVTPNTEAAHAVKPSFLETLAPLGADTGASKLGVDPISASGGSCATDGYCNFECGSPYDWDCASLACNEPNVCGWTGGVCPSNEECWVDICVCIDFGSF